MKKYQIILSTIMGIAIILAACAPTPAAPTSIQLQQAPTATENSGQIEKTVIIGFTSSLTGSLSVEAKRQNNGILLWMNSVNQRGGLVLSNELIVKFEPIFYDDQSSGAKAQELYERLAIEDNVDFFFGPYSSTLTDVVAPIADKYQKIMISPGAASDSTFKKGYRNIYQVYTPAGNYLVGALDLLAQKDPTAKRIAIVYENDRFSTSVVESLKKYAEETGFEIVVLESYNSDTTNFAPLVQKLIQANPDAIFGGGHLADGQALVKQAYTNSLKVKYMALLVAPSDSSFSDLGAAALGVIGPSQWEPQVQFVADFGPTVIEFNQAYQAAYSVEPSYHAAGGYAAGLILEKALLEAGSLDQQKIRAALDSTNIITFFGPLRFDRSEASHGLQIGHEMVYIQWQQNPDNTPAKQIVWPDIGKTAELVYPIR